MNVFVICNGKEQESVYLKKVSRENIARISEEKWRIEEFNELEEMRKLLAREIGLDVVYLDVTMETSIEEAERLRKQNKDAVLLLIADTSISPMSYLKPSIQAASLLLRPLRKQQVKKAVTDTWNLYLENQVSREECFVIEDGEKTVQVPYQKIYYFFSAAKKVYLVLEDQEFGFYDTLGNLEQRLPHYFIRCHRGFIVNRRKIADISLAKGEIMLEHDICVPVSRSYKPIMKEWKKWLKE